MEKRKGFLTPEQEQIVDDLYDGKGIVEMADGTAIKLADNKGLEMVKQKLVKKFGADILPDIYEIVDIIFVPLSEIAKRKKTKN